MPDPFENVMTMLRNKGSVDPNTAAARSASIKDQRRTVGATPPAQKKPPQGRGMPAPQPQGGVMGVGGDPGQPDMMTPVVKSLNEAILGLKAQIHRTTDPEQRRMLEQQAQQIRQRVVDMGGEPIWADESIEEGMQKLQSMGMPEQGMGTPEQGMGTPPGAMMGGGGMPDWAAGAMGPGGGGAPEWTDMEGASQRPDWTQLRAPGEGAPVEPVELGEEDEDHLGPWLKRRAFKKRMKEMMQQRQEVEE